MRGKIFAIQQDPLSLSELKGEGKQGVLVVISAGEVTEKTLADLLQAIKHDPVQDVKTLAVSQPTPIDLNALIETHHIRKMICFGYSPSDLGFHMNEAYYHPYAIGELTAIFSESIATLKADKTKKIALWQSLQKVFLS